MATAPRRSDQVGADGQIAQLRTVPCHRSGRLLACGPETTTVHAVDWLARVLVDHAADNRAGGRNWRTPEAGDASMATMATGAAIAWVRPASVSR